jgi:hypothetical protein
VILLLLCLLLVVSQLSMNLEHNRPTGYLQVVFNSDANKPDNNA